MNTPVNPREPDGTVRPAPQRPLRSKRSRTSTEERLRYRRLASYAALAVSAAFMINALVGENGLLGRIKAKRDYEVLSQELATLRHENNLMREQARRLKDDPSAIEEAARRDLNLIRPGETLVIVKDAKPVSGK